MSELEIAKLRSSIQECNAHAEKIERDLRLIDFIPMDHDRFSVLNEDEIEHLDQMIYRFTKLQDAMGRRLMRSLYFLLEPESDPAIPFIDILNRLEKMDILSSVDNWEQFRELRKNLAHEYPERVTDTVLTLNRLYRELPKLIEQYRSMREYAKAKFEV